MISSWIKTRSYDVEWDGRNGNTKKLPKNRWEGKLVLQVRGNEIAAGRAS